jgi:hypothetical protein
MIRVMNPIPEPANFESDCRTPGKEWLTNNPLSEKFPNLWRKFQPELSEGFHDRCGWWAMRIADGHVDHFLSKNKHRSLTYEWSNYRYIAGTVNSSKRTWDDQILDPFEIQDGWFELIIPSMQLVTTKALPAHLLVKANRTMEKLHLDNGTKVRRNRKRWYEDFKNNKVTLEGLEEIAPLIATAVKKRQAQNLPLL